MWRNGRTPHQPPRRQDVAALVTNVAFATEIAAFWVVAPVKITVISLCLYPSSGFAYPRVLVPLFLDKLHDVAWFVSLCSSCARSRCPLTIGGHLITTVAQRSAFCRSNPVDGTNLLG